MYWQNRIRVSIIADCMPFNWFNQVLKLVHVNDNNFIPDRATRDFNRCYKIQYILDYLCERFQSVVIPETCLVVND